MPDRSRAARACQNICSVSLIVARGDHCAIAGRDGRRRTREKSSPREPLRGFWLTRDVIAALPRAIAAREAVAGATDFPRDPPNS